MRHEHRVADDNIVAVDDGVMSVRGFAPSRRRANIHALHDCLSAVLNALALRPLKPPAVAVGVVDDDVLGTGGGVGGDAADGDLMHQVLAERAKSDAARALLTGGAIGRTDGRRRLQRDTAVGRSGPTVAVEHDSHIGCVCFAELFSDP